MQAYRSSAYCKQDPWGQNLVKFESENNKCLQNAFENVVCKMEDILSRPTLLRFNDHIVWVAIWTTTTRCFGYMTSYLRDLWKNVNDSVCIGWHLASSLHSYRIKGKHKCPLKFISGSQLRVAALNTNGRVFKLTGMSDNLRNHNFDIIVIGFTINLAEISTLRRDWGIKIILCG